MADWYNNSTEASGIRFAFPAVLFADIAGSTSLYDALGDSVAKTLVDECLRVMRTATDRHHGRVIKTIGDELMCVFPDSDRSSLAAADMQLAVSELPQAGGVRRTIRVGFHSGPIIEADNDVFGDTVNTAARMAALAKGGQIITTMATVARMSPLLRASTRHIAALSIRGKGDDVDVCEVLWRANEDLTMATSSAASAAAQSLDLRHGARSITLEGAGARLVIGRDSTSHIVLAGRKASRVHARIELRRDKFFLTDQSTNGTYVSFTGEAELALRHEEVMLRGHGQITFGHSLAESAQETLEFLVR
jgi:adenylate cyclase